MKYAILYRSTSDDKIYLMGFTNTPINKRDNAGFTYTSELKSFRPNLWMPIDEKNLFHSHCFETKKK